MEKVVEESMPEERLCCLWVFMHTCSGIQTCPHAHTHTQAHMHAVSESIAVKRYSGQENLQDTTYRRRHLTGGLAYTVTMVGSLVPARQAGRHCCRAVAKTQGLNPMLKAERETGPGLGF